MTLINVNIVILTQGTYVNIIILTQATRNPFEMKKIKSGSKCYFVKSDLSPIPINLVFLEL